MKNNIKPWLYGPNWQGQRCEALTRRGSLCKRPGNKKNGRFKFHNIIGPVDLPPWNIQTYFPLRAAFLHCNLLLLGTYKLLFRRL